MVDSIYQGCYEMARGSYNIHHVGTSPRKQNCPQDWFSWQQCSPCPFLCIPLNWLLPEVVLAVNFHWMSSPGMGRRRNPRNMLGSQLSRTSVLGTCRIRASEALRTARAPLLTEEKPRAQNGWKCGPKSHSISMSEPGLERTFVTAKWFSIL